MLDSKTLTTTLLGHIVTVEYITTPEVINPFGNLATPQQHHITGIRSLTPQGQPFPFTSLTKGDLLAVRRELASRGTTREYTKLPPP